MAPTGLVADEWEVVIAGLDLPRCSMASEFCYRMYFIIAVIPVKVSVWQLEDVCDCKQSLW